MSTPGQIFEWESITLPSYYSKQTIVPTGLKARDQIVATGANTVTLVTNFFQADKFSNSVYLKREPNNPDWGESDSFAEVEQAILSAKSRGLKVVLKPHVETENRVWRAELAPSDPKTWFASYKAMMVEYAKTAQAAGADMICVGTEMDSMIDPTKSFVDDNGVAKTYTQAWAEIIDAVRAVYSGPVTYAATYWTVQKVAFWDKVDFIGVDAYIPSSTVDDPTVSQIMDAWIKPHFNPWVRDLHGGGSVVDYYKALSEQYGKQILFTEVGYRSKDGANKDPGVFGGDGEYDSEEQVDCYEALFNVMENYGGQWLAGSFLWSYYSFENPMEERGVSWTDYTTQHKPANGTVTTHYSSPAHVTGLVWNGTAAADKLDGGYHNDTLNGAGSDDKLWGGAGHDEINGAEGNDVLTAGFGNDILNGGAGDHDKVVFSGLRTDYSITKNQNGSFTVVDNRDRGDGRDTITDVESFQFSDLTMPPPSDPTGGGGTGGDGVQDLLLIGRKKADVLIGGAGNDRIYGKAGKDVLTGGAGKDTFVFDTKPNRKNVDKIIDFSALDDTIYVDNAFLKKLGKGKPSAPKPLSKKFFALDKAKDGNDYLIYSTKTGVLSLDADGSGADQAIKIAKLPKSLPFTHADVMVI